jgi:hypothetical protein
MLVRALALTVSASDPDIPERAAEILAWPAATLVTNPAAETVATAELDDDQTAVEVMSFVEPSLYLAVAVSCWVCPAIKVTAVGATVIEDSVGCELFAGGVFEVPPPPQETKTSETYQSPSILRNFEIDSFVGIISALSFLLLSE